jgi:hypothetical protein
MKAELVIDDNESINEQYGTDDDDDSLAAMASDEDDDYTEFVDACGRSLCSEARGRDMSTPTNHRTASNAPVVTPPRKQQSHTFIETIPERKPFSQSHISTIPEKKLFAPNQASSIPEPKPSVPSQVSYGPNGLIFNMNEPWERSLQRQLQSGVLNQHILVNDNNNFQNSRNSTLLLGHTESRDFALEVNRDDISLGTNASSTVPNTMQIVHRSFLNQYMMQQQNQPRYSFKQEDEVEGFPRIGDVVKGCRSVDESTVSYLTNQFGPCEEFRVETQDAKWNHTYGIGAKPVKDQAYTHSNNFNSRSNVANGYAKSANNTDNAGGGGSNNEAFPVLHKSRNIQNELSHNNKFLEVTGSINDETNSTANETNSMQMNGAYSTMMAPDPACFCMGYNMLDYVLPPVTVPDVTHFTNPRRYNVPRTRLTRVDENFKSSSPVINMARPDDALNYIRYKNGRESQKHHSNTRNKRVNTASPAIHCNENYCGIDV